MHSTGYFTLVEMQPLLIGIYPKESGIYDDIFVPKAQKINLHATFHCCNISTIFGKISRNIASSNTFQIKYNISRSPESCGHKRAWFPAIDVHDSQGYHPLEGSLGRLGITHWNGSNFCWPSASFFASSIHIGKLGTKNGTHHSTPFWDTVNIFGGFRK